MPVGRSTVSALVELPIAFGAEQYINPSRIDLIRTHEAKPGTVVVEVWMASRSVSCIVDEDQAAHVVAELLRIAAGPKTVVMP